MKTIDLFLVFDFKKRKEKEFDISPAQSQQLHALDVTDKMNTEPFFVFTPDVRKPWQAFTSDGGREVEEGRREGDGMEMFFLTKFNIILHLHQM